MLTSIECVETSFLILRKILSFGSPSKRDKNSAAVFNFPELCAIVKQICGTKLHAFHNGGGTILFWEN